MVFPFTTDDAVRICGLKRAILFGRIVGLATMIMGTIIYYIGTIII